MTDDSREPHVYRPRQVPDMSRRSFRFGEGRISGALSVVLGALSLLAVLCYRYPTLLTTRELREVYDPDVLRWVLLVAMWSSLGFALSAFVLAKRKTAGAVGALFTLSAFALGGHGVETGPLKDRPLAVGLDFLVLDLLFTGAAFVFIEKLWPKYRDQVILRPGWRLDLIYFGINHLLISVFLLSANTVAPRLLGWAAPHVLRDLVGSFPLVGQVVLLVFCADMVQYACHRAFHEVPWLWRFHAVHHSSEHLDWLAGSRQHFLDALVARTLTTVPLHFVGADKAAIDAYVIFAAVQTVFIHSNVGIRFGPLKYLLVTPQFHHWHHSSDRPAIDTNYAVHLPLWDKLFGSYHMPDEHWPREYGTVAPLPPTFWGQFFYPLIRR